MTGAVEHRWKNAETRKEGKLTPVGCIHRDRCQWAGDRGPWEWGEWVWRQQCHFCIRWTAPWWGRTPGCRRCAPCVCWRPGRLSASWSSRSSPPLCTHWTLPHWRLLLNGAETRRRSEPPSAPPFERGLQHRSYWNQTISMMIEDPVGTLSTILVNINQQTIWILDRRNKSFLDLWQQEFQKVHHKVSLSLERGNLKYLATNLFVQKTLQFSTRFCQCQFLLSRSTVQSN